MSSDDWVRCGLKLLDLDRPTSWLPRHLDYVARLFMSERWIRAVDSRVKPIYGYGDQRRSTAMRLTRRFFIWLPAALLLAAHVRPSGVTRCDGWILRADDR